MEPKDYIVSRIEGEYAYLKRTDIESEEELFIAMALLPLGVDIGTKLHYECMEYSILRQPHQWAWGRHLPLQ